MPRARAWFYLFNFRNKAGGNLSHTCPSSAKHCTSVCVANIRILSTSVPGSSAPSSPSAFLPFVPRGKKLLPKYIRSCCRSSTAQVSPWRERSCSVWRGHIYPSPSALPQRTVLAACILYSSLSKVQRCLYKDSSMNWVSLSCPGEGFVSWAMLSYLPVLGDHVGEGRKPRLVLQNYL